MFFFFSENFKRIYLLMLLDSYNVKNIPNKDFIVNLSESKATKRFKNQFKSRVPFQLFLFDR